MNESNRNDASTEADVALCALHVAVPTLVQRLDERLLASHVRDLVAVCGAYLERRVNWPALLVGLEAAFFQARACMVDDATGEALVKAAAAVARYAGAQMDHVSGGEEADDEAPVMGVCNGPAETHMVDTPNPESAPGEPAGTEVAGSGPPSTGTEPLEPDGERPQSGGAPASGTGFASSLSLSKANANPKVQKSYPKAKANPKAESEQSTS